jgi:hypothetical protein
MGIRQGKPASKTAAKDGRSSVPALPLLPFSTEIPLFTSAEAQVKETLHQFESASSQGEGNG